MANIRYSFQMNNGTWKKKIVLTSENLVEINRVDQTGGGLTENLLFKKSMCFVTLRDVPFVPKFCRKLRYTAGGDLTIEFFNVYLIL